MHELKELMLRLRKDGKVVGYLKIGCCPYSIYFVEKVGDKWTPIFTAGLALPIWDSFDLSLKQGDAWFFAGDEVEARSEIVARGILEFDKCAWVIRDKNNTSTVIWNDSTLTLIRRAE